VAHPLDGIREKIKRANEHIRNLDAEITPYLDGADHTLTTTVKYDASKGGLVRDWRFSGSPLPERFSVIIGEVIHQLRSSLDHLVWQLVIAHSTEKTSNHLEFPIFREPGKYPTAARRKIKGVSLTAAKRIEGLQPYHATGNIEDHPLLITHNLDIIDKHQLLIIVAGELKVWGADIMNVMWNPSPGELDKVITHRLTRTPSAHADTNYQLAFDIAFETFGSRKGEAVIPSLQQLTDFVSGVIDSFSAEFK
jgi:hypothetical protein